MEDIGSCLKKLRADSALSLKAVSEATGIADSTLSRIESGDNKQPSAEQLKKLAHIYKANVIQLFAKCGYLEAEDLDGYQMFFSGTDKLLSDERELVQNMISMLIRNRGNDR